MLEPQAELDSQGPFGPQIYHFLKIVRIKFIFSLYQAQFEVFIEICLRIFNNAIRIFLSTGILKTFV